MTRRESFAVSLGAERVIASVLATAAAITPPKLSRSDLPDRLAAATITAPPARLETALIWREDDPSPTNGAFREAAQTVFPRAPGNSDSH